MVEILADYVLTSIELSTTQRNKVSTLEQKFLRKEKEMKLRDEYLAMNDGNMIEAASYFAIRLTRDDAETFKVGYTQENAILAAIEIFPEVTAFQIRFNNGWEV